MRRSALFVLLATVFSSTAARAQDVRIISLEVYPARRTQLAVWLEHADGSFVRTLGLTQAVAYRGIGNRPGATQMNSGFRWPYGRREGVLPVWAHRRAAAPGAERFSRVIFQNRLWEGWASRSSADHSLDDYYCLSFQRDASSMDALDAVTCPSLFNSDKGRYLTPTDQSNGYAEPAESAPGVGLMMPLSMDSLYPPRRDVTRCTSTGCYDHADVERYVDDVRRVMPEIDAVTMATPPESLDPMTLMYTVPADWPDGEYVLWIEANTEGDYNSAWDPAHYPTPQNPTGTWDSWAINYGYPYRGQPSVVYRVPFVLGQAATIATVAEPAGYGALQGESGDIFEMDSSITTDPIGSPGSGADRLRLGSRPWRARVRVIGPEVCNENAAPGPIESVEVTEFAERRSAHRFAHLRFAAPEDDFGISHYEVRVSSEPIIDEESFLRALPAQAATLESEALVVPTDAIPGELVDVDFGGLAPERRYYIGVRAVDICNVAGVMAVGEYVTPSIEFTTVSPCFVATAAWGTPMAVEIDVLRRFRERHLRTNALGRAFIAVYERVGPHLADMIREHPERRALTRTLLAPLVSFARFLER